jgi:hypothetical protein
VIEASSERDRAVLDGRSPIPSNAAVVFMNLDVAGTRTGADASMTLSGGLMEAPTPLEGKFEKDRFTGTWLGPGATEPATVVLERE